MRSRNDWSNAEIGRTANAGGTPRSTGMGACPATASTAWRKTQHEPGALLPQRPQPQRSSRVTPHRGHAMRQLQHCQPVPATPLVQPSLPALRRTHHPAPGHTANHATRVHQPQACQPGAMGGAWPQRGANPHTGIWPAGLDTRVWPGRTCGIRPPGEGETPLSHAEVAHAVNLRLIG